MIASAILFNGVFGFMDFFRIRGVGLCFRDIFLARKDGNGLLDTPPYAQCVIQRLDPLLSSVFMPRHAQSPGDCRKDAKDPQRLGQNTMDMVAFDFFKDFRGLIGDYCNPCRKAAFGHPRNLFGLPRSAEQNDDDIIGV